MTPTSNILVGRIGGVFWLRVEGRGSYQNSMQVKRAFQAVIEEGMHDLVIDLERCSMMDSTFLGTLTGTALLLMEHGGGTLSVLNANSRNLQILNDLGLDQILDVDTQGTRWPEERRTVCEDLATCQEQSTACKLEQTEHVLTAHQLLSNVNQENRSRFRDVIHFLEKELDASQNAVPAPT